MLRLTLHQFGTCSRSTARDIQLPSISTRGFSCAVPLPAKSDLCRFSDRRAMAILMGRTWREFYCVDYREVKHNPLTHDTLRSALRAACKNNGGGVMGKKLRQKYNPPIQNQGLNHIFPTKSARSHEFLALFLSDAHANAALGQQPERDRRQ